MLGAPPLQLLDAAVSPAVFSQGDKGTSWYIIWKGSVNVVTHGKVGASLHSEGLQTPHVTVPQQGRGLPPHPLPSLHPPTQGLVATLHEGDDFGQLALVNDAPRAATIILREDNCHFLRVDKQDFNHILKVSRGLTRCRVRAGTHHAPSPWCLEGRMLFCMPIWGFGVQPAS